MLSSSQELRLLEKGTRPNQGFRWRFPRGPRRGLIGSEVPRHVANLETADQADGKKRRAVPKS
jgi:hypothetical protein